ncbi:MAG: RDD family protein [Gammaproteobacteria bacterium]
MRPFREDEEHLFFGRESKVDVMVDKLAATRFLAVVGTSGSGKSSLVNCGLRPALHRGLMADAGPSWRIAQFRPGFDPVASLADVLAAEGVLFSDYTGELPLQEIIETYLTQSTQGLVDTVRMADLPEGVNLLVVVDQFEELFRFGKLGTNGAESVYGTSEEAIAFVNLLLEAHVDPTVPIYVVITMRSDFLGDCSQFHGLPEAINQGQFLVPRLTRDERRAGIAGPVAVGGAEISPVLLTRLVNDVGDNPDQLSILQHALHRTWACWEGHGAEGLLELAHYEEIGSMGRALNQHADEAFAALETPGQQKICEKIFKALTDLGTDPRGIRRPMKLGTLCDLVGGRDEESEVKAVIEVFRDPSRAFLMPPANEPLDPEKVIDISHESLMRVWEKLRNWAEEEAQSARRYRRLAETAILEAAGKAGLWSDPDLQLALDWQKEHSPTAAWANLYGGGFETAFAFLEKSRTERDTELANELLDQRWRTRWRLIILAICAGFALWIYDMYHWRLTEALTKGFELEQFEARGDEAPSAFKEEPIQVKGRFIAVGLILLLCYFGPPLVLFFAFDYFGKRLFRRMAFPKIMKEVAALADKAVREEKLATANITEVAEALQTTYAGFWRRVGTYILDSSLFSAVSVLVLWGIGETPLANLVSIDDGTILLPPLVYGWCYAALTLSSARQATLGMRAMGILATDQHARRLSFGGATAWHFAKVLSYATLGLGFFLRFNTKRRQTLHDLVTRVVILSRPDQRKVPWWMIVLCCLLGVIVAYMVSIAYYICLVLVLTFLL